MLPDGKLHSNDEQMYAQAIRFLSSLHVCNFIQAEYLLKVAKLFYQRDMKKSISG